MVHQLRKLEFRSTNSLSVVEASEKIADLTQMRKWGFGDWRDNSELRVLDNLLEPYSVSLKNLFLVKPDSGDACL